MWLFYFKFHLVALLCRWVFTGLPPWGCLVFLNYFVQFGIDDMVQLFFICFDMQRF